MPYGTASFTGVVSKYQLDFQPHGELFAEVVPRPPGPVLTYYLGRPARDAIAQANEKAKSESIIAPFLQEAVEQSREPVILFSGITLNVTAELSGSCDFLISRGIIPYGVEAPILAVVEAKGNQISEGMGQCAAEMVAAQLFNEQRSRTGPVFGIVTDGSIWQFFRLDEKRLTRQRDVIHLVESARLLGILVAILDGTV